MFLLLRSEQKIEWLIRNWLLFRVFFCLLIFSSVFLFCCLRKAGRLLILMRTQHDCQVCMPSFFLLIATSEMATDQQISLFNVQLCLSSLWCLRQSRTVDYFEMADQWLYLLSKLFATKNVILLRIIFDLVVSSNFLPSYKLMFAQF